MPEAGGRMGSPNPGLGRTILVVDDDAMVRRSLGRLLERAGYELRFAEHGLAALESFAVPGIDLVLLDLNMPGIRGFEVCRRIRALPLPLGADVPILMLTGEQGEEIYQEAIESGADDFLNKPIQFTELLLRVSSMLRLGTLLASLRHSVSIVQTQYEALQLARKERDHLNTFLLHDLKSPIANILLQAEMMREQPDLEETQRNMWTSVFESAAHARKLLTGWLDFSTWEELGFELDIHPVAPEGLVAGLRAHVEPWVRHKELRFEAAIDPALTSLHLDETAMTRVLRNILDNCVRYAPVGSVLGLDLLATPDRTTRIRITDQGPGIPPNAREAIFDLFTQLEATSSRAPRDHQHGMGLAFCKLAVEAHGGRIWAEEAPSGGSCFVIELPQEGPIPGATALG